MRKSHLNLAHFVALAIAGQMTGAACIAQCAPQSSEETLLTAAQEAARNDDFNGIQRLEARALAALDAKADRQGSRLILHLTSGAAETYANRPECGIPAEESKCQLYVLVAHVSSYKTFVVAKLHYESSQYLLVDDATGEETALPRFPNFSPSGSHVLVCVSNDQRVGFAVQVWRRKDHKFVLEWSGSPYTDGIYTAYRLIHWRSEDSIELLAETSFEPPRPSVTRHFQLRNSGRGWKLVETS